MRLTVPPKPQQYKHYEILEQSHSVLYLSIIFCFTATILSIMIYVFYRELVNACIDEDTQLIRKACSNIELLIVFAVIWSIVKIMLVTYLFYLKLI